MSCSGAGSPGRKLRHVGLRRPIATYERQVELVRGAGALSELPIHGLALALGKAWLGDLAGARLLIAESDSVSAATGNQVPPFAVLRLLALRGRESEASPLIKAVILQGTAGGQGHAVMVATGRPRSCTTAEPATRRRPRQPAK